MKKEEFSKIENLVKSASFSAMEKLNNPMVREKIMSTDVEDFFTNEWVTKTKRNKDIAIDYLYGNTLKEISERYRVSVSRVRQIAIKAVILQLTEIIKNILLDTDISNIDPDNISIHSIGLSISSSNYLRRKGIRTMGDVIRIFKRNGVNGFTIDKRIGYSIITELMQNEVVIKLINLLEKKLSNDVTKITSVDQLNDNVLISNIPGLQNIFVKTLFIHNITTLGELKDYLKNNTFDSMKNFEYLGEGTVEIAKYNLFIYTYIGGNK